MAGQNATQKSELKDLDQVLTFHLPATVQRYVPLFYADRNCAVENAVIRVEVLDTNTADLTANLARVAAGTVLSTNTDVTTGVGVGSGASGMATVTQPMPLVTSTGSPSENRLTGEVTSVRDNTSITRGELLILEFSAAPNSSMTGCFVQVRITGTLK